VNIRLFSPSNKDEITNNHILIDVIADAAEKAEHLSGSVSVRFSSDDLPVTGKKNITNTNNLQVVIEAFFKEDIQKKVGEQLIKLLLGKTLGTNFTNVVIIKNQNIMLTHGLVIEPHRVTIKILYFNRAGVFDEDAVHVKNDYEKRIKKITEHFS